MHARASGEILALGGAGLPRQSEVGRLWVGVDNIETDYRQNAGYIRLPWTSAELEIANC
jgi:hypothetical protein